MDRITATDAQNQLSSLTATFSGVDKIDKFVLPMPYCQLMKVFLLFFIMAFPFCMATELGKFWTPIASIMSTFPKSWG